MNAAAIILIILLIVIAAIVIGWLLWRHHRLINVNQSNANNPEFLRAYNNLQLIINQLEVDTGDIVVASINRELEPCDELFINRYPDRIEDLDTGFTDLKMAATVSSDEMSADGGRKLTEAVNTYTLDIANAKNSFDQSVKQGGAKCTGSAFDAVRQTYVKARPNVQILNQLSAEITKSLQ